MSWFYLCTLIIFVYFSISFLKVSLLKSVKNQVHEFCDKCTFTLIFIVLLRRNFPVKFVEGQLMFPPIIRKIHPLLSSIVILSALYITGTWRVVTSLQHVKRIKNITRLCWNYYLCKNDLFYWNSITINSGDKCVFAQREKLFPTDELSLIELRSCVYVCWLFFVNLQISINATDITLQ